MHFYLYPLTNFNQFVSRARVYVLECVYVCEWLMGAL